MTAVLVTQGIDISLGGFTVTERVWPVYELCAHCQRPMVDGGAPLPGEGKLSPAPRACASCWAEFHRIAAYEEETQAVQAEIDAGVWCDHGVALEDPCQACEDEIMGDPEKGNLTEIID